MLHEFECPDCHDSYVNIMVCEEECLFVCPGCESEFSQEALAEKAEQMFKASEMLRKTFELSQAINNAEFSAKLSEVA